MSYAFAAAGVITYLLAQHTYQVRDVADVNAVVYEPPATVSIIIPAYNEGGFIEHTLLGILDQNIIRAYPESFDITVVDNESTDDTALVASKYAKVISAARGKLNAKNAGVDATIGDIVVFMDADADVQPNFLNLLLRHFHDLNVVAVGGGIYRPDGTLFERTIDTIGNQANSWLQARLYGGVSAVRRTAFYAVGGHRTDVDQITRSIVQEEERDFLSRLKTKGTIVIDSQAVLRVSSRRDMCNQDVACRFDSPTCDYCSQQASGERF